MNSNMYKLALLRSCTLLVVTCAAVFFQSAISHAQIQIRPGLQLQMRQVQGQRLIVGPGGVIGGTEYGSSQEAVELAPVKNTKTFKKDVQEKPEDIKQLIKQLGSQNYFDRELAMRKLRDGGFKTIQLLAETVEDSPLEVSTRSMRLLGEGCLNVDIDVSKEVEKYLFKLETSKNRQVALKASEALIPLMLKREREALEFLEENHAIVQNLQRYTSEGTVSLLTIEINDQWTGGDDGLECLNRIKNIGQLNINNKTLTGAALRKIVNVQASQLLLEIGEAKEEDFDIVLNQRGEFSLELLSIIHHSITDEFVKKLIKYQALQGLTIDSKNITDKSLSYLVKLPIIRSIDLNHAKITDDSVAVLKDARLLRELAFKNIPLTDDSVAGLTKLDNLQDLKIYGTKISKEGKAKIEAAIHDINVDLRRGALLGIAGNLTPNHIGVHVSLVRKGTAADKAGILANDVITNFDDSRVRNFQELTSLIAEKNVGDTAKIILQRDNPNTLETEVHHVTVTFGEWSSGT